jgi:DNA repair protein RecN (Recombination protein N)
VLEEMRIRGLGVITDAVLEFGPGLTVLTGETGAGKTMVVTGLSLLLGGRSDPGAVRSGASSAVVEGRVLVAPGSTLARAVGETGAELDGDELLLARTISAAGRSRAHVGGRAVPVGVLAELAAELVTVHGQSDQLRLLQPARQREALDRFAGHQELLTTHGDRYRQLREVQERLDDVAAHVRERAQEADLIRLGLAEISEVDPQPGEDQALREEDARLAHADALRTAAETAHAALRGDGIDDSDGAGSGADLASLLSTGQRSLDAVREHDPALGDLGRRLGEIGYLAQDVAGELASYAAGVESDPARLAAVQGRRAALGVLTRKYGPDADQVLAWARDAADRLTELDDDDTRIDRLTAERDALRAQVGAAAARLSAARAEAGGRLAERVSAELAQLAMPNARLSVGLSQRESQDGLDVPLADGRRRLAVGPHGVDEVELLLAPHAGAPARPIAKGASGGELSRVMLGLEVVLAGVDPVPTFVFDEVDAGVGGRAAAEIGRRLAALAGTAQVLVVTHLPQVAAYADQHLIVVKSDDGQITESGVRAVDDDARVAELARMLAGQEDSDTARSHARELRESAVAEVAALRGRAGGKR